MKNSFFIIMCFCVTCGHGCAGSGQRNVLRPAPIRSDSLIVMGSQASEREQYGLSLEYFQEALQKSPDNILAIRGLGDLHDRTGDTESAIYYYSILAVSSRALPGDFVALARLLAKAGRPGEQEKILRKALGSYPGNKQIQTAAGLFLAGRHNDDEALFYLEKAARKGCTDARVFKALSGIYTSRKQWGPAAKFINKYLRLRSDDFDMQMKSAFILFNESNYAQSLKHYRAAYELRPKSVDAGIGIAKSLEQLGRINGAIHAYKRVVETKGPSKGMAPVYTSLANLLNKKGRFEQTVSLIGTTGINFSGDAGISCALGVAFAGQGLYEKAAAAFEKALFDPLWGSFARSQIDLLQTKKRLR